MMEQQFLDQTPSPQPKSNRKLHIVTLFVIFLFFVLSAAYLSYQNQQLKKQLNQLATNQDFNQVTSPSTATPTSNPIDTNFTTDWETYVSVEYSFKHPQGLKFDTSAADTGYESIRFQFMGPRQIASGRTETSLFDGYMFTIKKTESNTNITPLQLAQDRASNTLDNCGPDVVVSTPKNITIDAVDGAQYTVQNCMGDYTNTYFFHQNNLYEITQLYVGELPDQEQYRNITNQMLHTFKFN